MAEIDILDKAYPHVKNWGIAVDGGANKGIWSLELARKFDKVIAFEPHVGAFLELANNTKNVPNIQIIEQALGHEIKDVYLHSRRKVGFTDSHVILGEEGDTAMFTLDYYNLDIGLLKLDMEGFEYFALLGATETIKRCSPVIVIESIPRFDKRYNLKPRQSLEYIRSFGYTEVIREAPNRVFVKKVKQ